MLERYADPRQQFLYRKGLGHVVVRAHIQAHDLVADVVLGRQHYYGLCAVLAHAPADLYARQPWQHQVQQHQVMLVLQRLVQALAAVVCHVDLVAFVRQLQLDIARQHLFILN